MSKVKILPDVPGYCVGEGPHWIEKDQSLIYVDIPKGNLHRYFYDSPRIQSLHLENAGTGDIVSFVVPIEEAKDLFVVGVGRTVCTVQWSTSEPDNQVKKSCPLVSVDDDVITTRFNDGKCDPVGRLWAGTTDNAFGPDITPQKGSLYRFNADKTASKAADKISISNGLAWSNDYRIFYYIDTLNFTIDAYDFDVTSGNISNRRALLDFKANPRVSGYPDGMTIDVDGNLWVACYGAAQVICIDPYVEKVIRKISIPSLKTTSCCWGGPDYSTLFVTSANFDFSEDEWTRYPEAGKTFAVTGLESKGMPPKEFILDKKFWNTS